MSDVARRTADARSSGRRVAGAVALILAGVAGGWLASQAQVAGKADVKLLLENDSVRVREIVLPPGSSTGQHRHQVPELSYSFTEGSLRVTAPGGEPVIEQWHAGEARWRVAGVEHEIANAGEQPMRVLVIDVKTVNP
jgi:quercetin dioxygenase-like cupin family protein